MQAGDALTVSRLPRPTCTCDGTAVRAPRLQRRTGPCVLLHLTAERSGLQRRSEIRKAGLGPKAARGSEAALASPGTAPGTARAGRTQ